jgi:hypothetical protein
MEDMERAAEGIMAWRRVVWRYDEDWSRLNLIWVAIPSYTSYIDESIHAFLIHSVACIDVWHA